MAAAIGGLLTRSEFVLHGAHGGGDGLTRSEFAI